MIIYTDPTQISNVLASHSFLVVFNLSYRYSRFTVSLYLYHFSAIYLYPGHFLVPIVFLENVLEISFMYVFLDGWIGTTSMLEWFHPLKKN